MLKLDKIAITHFKNYEISSFDFKSNAVGICGLNGRGKTNLLDAIYYCCFTKSFFSASDSYNIGFGKTGFRLQATFNRQDAPAEVVCIHRGGNRKEIALNGVAYEKFSNHLGYLPVVMIAPDDVALITEGSENRRRFIDTVLSQYDHDYLEQLIIYNKILLQRNSLLKTLDDRGNSSFEVLDIYDQQLIEPATVIHKKRNEFMFEIFPLVTGFYKNISGGAEEVGLKYISQLTNNDFTGLIKSSRYKDIQLQRTTTGIHKDDITFTLNEEPFRNIASQGQRKSLLFSLKLAEYELLKKYKGFAPLLLLDDVFEKLDDQRMGNLLHWVCKDNVGQVFITDTHCDRLAQTFEKLGISGQIIRL